MSDPLTREELKAMLEVQTKNTEQMVLIAQRLQKITEQHSELADCQKRVIDRLYNGLAKEIKDEVRDSIAERFKTSDLVCGEIKKDLKIVKMDVFWVKIIFGTIAFIATITSVIIRISHWLGYRGGL